MTDVEKQLIIENNELRIRLAENKMLINALKDDDTDSNQVMTGDCPNNAGSSSKDDPYEFIIGEMKESACVLSEDNSIIYCNKLFVETFAIAGVSILGKDILKVVSRNDKNIMETLQRARKKGKSSIVITFINHTDVVKYFLLSVSSLSYNSSFELFLLFTDITEIKDNRLTNELLLNHARLAALNIMEDEISAKNELAKTNKKLIEEIRERKKSELELQQSRFNLLEAQKIARIGNWIYDLKSKQLVFSDEIYRIFGFELSHHALSYEELKNLIRPEYWQPIDETSQAAIEEGVNKHLEIKIHRRNGESCTVYVIFTPEFNAAGKIIKLNGTVQDITERKKIEEALIKVNRLYNVISRINQMIVHNQRRETIFSEACNIVIRHGKFRMAWIGLLDEEKETIVPVAWAGAEHGYLKKIKVIPYTNIPEGNGPTGLAIRKGKYFYCNDIAHDPVMSLWKEEALERNFRASIAFPIRLFGKVIGAFTIYVTEPHFFNQTEIDLLSQVTSDISFALEVIETEQKRLEAEKAIKKMNAELEQRVNLRTQQLEQANKELEAFTYSVSHDLRAPLRNINGWSQVLLDECKESLGENGLKYMDRVLSETLRMNNLIEDLMKLSRVTLIEKKKESVDLTGIANTIAHRLQDKPINHQLEIIVQPGLRATGDPRLLEIALTNLLENSYKFTGKLSHAVIEFGESTIDGKQTFWVRDNGVGFDMANAKNLFGVFQRMHNQNDFPGTGIGLATVQRIIHRHDGIIWANSKINEGTTFYFTIPEESF
ncbi:MAG: GAF domain-containing protein [Bacteroidota bacterium]|nr:GAF domain-containing protein [Bacteroidota bacterium]